MSRPTIPIELIDAIIDQVALIPFTNYLTLISSPNYKPGSPTGTRTSTLSSCALVSRALVSRCQKYIFDAIDLDRTKPRGMPRAMYYCGLQNRLRSNPHLGTYVKHFRFADDPEEAWIAYPETPISETLSFFPHLYSFALKFNSRGAIWDDLPDDTRAAFERVFRTESVKEVELEFFSEFPVPLLMSLTRLKYLALSNVYMDVDLDADMEVGDAWSGGEPPREVALEGLYLRGVSPGVIQTFTKTLSSADGPRTLRKLALTPTFDEGFDEAVMELIATCGSHLTSFAWLPIIYFPSLLGSITITHLHHLRSLYLVIEFKDVSFDDTLSLLLQISTRPTPNIIEKITLECHCITFPYTATPRDSEKILVEVWKPLDTALCATRSESEHGLELIFGDLKEVKIILSAGTNMPEAIDRFMVAKEELLPSVEARGVVVTVRVDETDEKRFLDRLREM